MKYFEDTDTLLIELKPGSVAETRDLDENTLLSWTPRARCWPSCWSTPPSALNWAVSPSTA